MASLIFAAGALTYDKIAASRQNRRALKESHHATRFAELEKAHSEEQTRYQTQAPIEPSPESLPPPYTELPTQSQPRGAEMRSSNPFRDAVATERRSSESYEIERRDEGGLGEMDGVVLAGGNGSGKGNGKGFREKILGRKRKEDAVIR